MKRKYADTLRSGSALGGTPRPEAADERLARTETLFREANRDRIKEHQDEEQRRQGILLEAAREAARKEGAEHGIHFVTFSEKGGELVPTVHVFDQASPAIVALMNESVPLMTGLTWKGQSPSERAALLDYADMPSDLVFAETVLEVLPEKSKAHLLGWQGQINSGAAFSGSLSVGNRAESLIENGYLLHGKEPIDAAPGRSSIEGRPGSASYVLAIMGKPYLDWLLANEQHPIEA